MKTGWLLYDESDLKLNRDFAARMESEAPRHELRVETVRTSQLAMGVAQGGALTLRKDGRESLPDFVISRQRDDLTSAQLELMGVPVFNGSAVCRLCNDKRRTHQFLAGLPMMETLFVNHRYAVAPSEEAYPVVIKPACSHGGEHVTRVMNEYEWRDAADQILPHDMLQQRVAGEPGRDLRLYVLFGEVVDAVLRTAREGIVSNFKRGGRVERRVPSAGETALALQVIDRFNAAHAPLCFAGIDLLYHDGRPVIGEVEDVVGSRMLYQVGGTDVIALYLEKLSAQL